MIEKYLQAFSISLFLSLLLTPAVRLWAVRCNFLSLPKEDRWHKHPTALYGGIAIFFAFIIPFALFTPDKNNIFYAFLLGAVMSFGLGLFDDIFHITPYSKIATQVIIACTMVLMGMSFKIIANPLINIPVTIFWFVIVMNAVNILDNMDGLCAGIATIASAGLFLYYGFNGDYIIALCAALLLASNLGFLLYNFYPAKIFMGDCGSMFLGFMLASCAALGSSRDISNLLITLAIPVLVLAVPVFDTIFVALTRSSNGRSIYRGGRDHTSHRLVVLGMSERRAVLTLYAVSAAFTALVLLQGVLNLAISLVLIVSGIILLLFFGLFLSDVKAYSEEPKTNNRRQNNKIILSGMVYYKRRILEFFVDLIIICLSYISAYLLRFEGIISSINLKLIVDSLPIIIIIRLITFFRFGLYRGVWKYAGLYDLIAIFKAVTVSSVLSVMTLVLLFRFQGYSRALFFIDWLILLVAVSGIRVVLRIFSEVFVNFSKEGKKDVFIMGAGDAGELLLRELRRNKVLNLKPIGFLDDNPTKFDKKIHGIPILGSRQDIAKLTNKYKIAEIIVAISSLTEEARAEILYSCEKANVTCRWMTEIISK